MGADGGPRRHDRRQRLLSDDAVLLLLRVRAARARGADRVRRTLAGAAESAGVGFAGPRAEIRTAPVKVVVLTTSYPRHAGDMAGHFVRDAVEGVRELGVDVEVVSPASFRHFGIAYGHGVPGNLRRRPWLVPLLPAAFLAFVRAARRAARDADLVHAHWLPSALVALTARKPYLVQLWGTDVELGRRMPWLARPLLRRARLAIGASEFLADSARELGAREARVVPPSVAIPEDVAEPDEPPHVLFVGRLSPEKGILEFLAATEGMPRVIVGDGPLRDRVPEAVGFVPPSEVGAYYERAAVVCVPSRRDGLGFAAWEAMGWGRPVVATAVGGLVGITGVLVPPRDPRALRDALERLLHDAQLRQRLGSEARERARPLSGATSAENLQEAYEDAIEPRRR